MLNISGGNELRLAVGHHDECTRVRDSGGPAMTHGAIDSRDTNVLSESRACALILMLQRLA